MEKFLLFYELYVFFRIYSYLNFVHSLLVCHLSQLPHSGWTETYFTFYQEPSYQLK